MKMPLTDNQLMQMFADHDDDVAFERLYHKYKDALIRFSYGYTFNQAKAEEIAHDTFLKVYRYKKNTIRKKRLEHGFGLFVKILIWMLSIKIQSDEKKAWIRFILIS